MKLLDRYVVREFIMPFLLAIGAFVLIMLSSQLFWLMDLIIIKGIPVSTVMKLIIYMIPGTLVEALPLSVLFASIISLGRLVKDSELLVMRSTGVKFVRLVMPIIIAGAIVSISTFYINEKLAPATNYKAQEIVSRVILEEVNPDLKEKIFFSTPEDLYFYIKQVDTSTNSMKDIIVYELRRGTFPRLFTAKSGEITDQNWILYDGSINDLDENGMISTSMSFESLDIDMDRSKTEMYFGVQKSSSDMNMEELKRYIDIFRASGIDTTSYEVDYYLKTSQPLAALIFAILGVAMVRRSSRRGGTAVGMVVGTAITLVYYVVLAAFGSLGRMGKISPVFAAWMPNVIFIIASLWLLSRVDKMWLFPRKNGNKKSRETNAVTILMIVLPLVVMCSTSVFAGETEALIKGKNVFFDGNTELWGIYGGISISFDETYITADQAEFNMNTKIVNLIGNVTLSNEEGDFESNSAVFDLSTNELNFVEVKASIPYEDLEGRLYLGGDSFDVTSDTYRLLKGYVTTCDLDDPHYRIEAEEIEIIGSDRIFLVNFSYYEGDFKLITIPKFVIPLNGDGLQLPVIGYSYYEGWYVSLVYNYSFGNISYGSVYMDYYWLLGPGLGFKNVFNIGDSSSLKIYSYLLFNKDTGNTESKVEIEGDIDFAHDIGLDLDLSYVDYKWHTEDRDEELKTSISLDRSLDNSYTGLSYNSTLRNYGIYTNLTDVEFNYIGFISDNSTLTTDALYRYYAVDGEKIQNNLNYKVYLNTVMNNSRLQVVVQDEVYLEDIEDDDDEEETPPPWKALSRFPEVMVTIPGMNLNRDLGISLSGDVVMGRYVEDAIRDGDRSTVDGQKLEVDLKLGINGLKVSDKLLFSGNLRTLGSLYSLDKHRYGYGGQLNLRLELMKNSYLWLYYDYLSVEGSSPFVFDKVNSYNIVGGSVSSYNDVLNLSLAVRYDMTARKFYDSSFTLRFTPDDDLELSLTGRYDLNTLKPISTTAKLNVDIDDIVDLKLGASYNFNTAQWTRVETDADISIGWGWSVQWSAIYNFRYDDFTRAKIGITKDLHCRQISLMYDHVYRRVWLDFQINAFPDSSLSFGLDSEGVIF